MSDWKDGKHGANENVPTDKKIEDLYKLIAGIQVAMFTTRRADGHLVSRPMATQERSSGADLWFATDLESHKLDELENDPFVNLSYYRDGTREWVSVSGRARLVTDRAKVRENNTAWRAIVIALGLVLAAHEAATDVHSWRNPAEATGRYLSFLADTGYTLSDVERIAVPAKRGKG